MAMQEMLPNLQKSHEANEAMMAKITKNMEAQNAVLAALAKDPKDGPWKEPTEALSDLREFRKYNKQLQEQHGSLETVPTLPAPTGEPPVLSDSEDTERSISVVAETPAPANKPTKQPKKAKKKKPSKQGQAAPKVAENKGTRLPKRHRSISLGPAIEPTPDEVLGKPGNNQRDLDSQASADDKKAESGGAADVKGQEVPTLEQEAAGHASPKKLAKKRILAGPATQEAWELDMTVD
ncbi:hypothetical protein ABW21_db0202467 [Orbilia brochopaga]|nr:hypothetical protein ABW21_db0202467 [Drechslerella brochopaga]